MNLFSRFTDGEVREMLRGAGLPDATASSTTGFR
jgi:hypothetical protein